jgi:hypothetical protein
VRISVRALEQGRLFCIPGLVNQLLYFTARLIPARMLMHLAGIQNELPVEVHETTPFMLQTRPGMNISKLRRA